MYKIEIVRFNIYPDSEPIFRGSIFGNPFPIDDFTTRNKACNKFQFHFDDRIKKRDVTYLNELERLNKIGMEQGYLKLGCFCAPFRCHGETIKKFLEDNQLIFTDHI